MDKSIITAFRGDLTVFLASGAPNQWLEHPSRAYGVYVRKGLHYIEGEVHKTLDIANISVREDLRGKGIGGCIFTIAESMNPYAAVYVENVLNERLAGRLSVAGYAMMPKSNPPCFYKMRDW